MKAQPKTIEIPEGTTAEVQASKVKITGKLGVIERDFTHTKVKIEYEIDDDGVSIGILSDEEYIETGSTVAIVAASLEYGTSDIPMRPLFRPVFEEQIKDIVKDAAKDIKKRIKKVL